MRLVSKVDKSWVFELTTGEQGTVGQRALKPLEVEQQPLSVEPEHQVTDNDSDSSGQSDAELLEQSARVGDDSQWVPSAPINECNVFGSAQDTGTAGRAINSDEWRDIVDIFIAFFPAAVYSNRGLLQTMAERSAKECTAPVHLTYGKQGRISAGGSPQNFVGIEIRTYMFWVFFTKKMWPTATAADITGCFVIAL